MIAAVVNSSTVTGFMDDPETFQSFVNEWFAMIDDDGNGVLSRDEIRSGFGRVLPLGYKSAPLKEIDDICEVVFERFDEDGNGVIDRQEFKSFVMEIMHAIARGIGGSPVIVALEKDSFLMKIAQHELARDTSLPSS